LYEFSPSGVYNDYVAMSIGARSQSARTYLEKYVADFGDASLDEVILHSLKAIRDAMPSDSTLTAQNCCFGYLSAGKAFEIVEDEARIQAYLDQLPQLAPTRSPLAEDEPATASAEQGEDI
jgi:20S proteasome subunit alpha 6